MVYIYATTVNNTMLSFQISIYDLGEALYIMLYLWFMSHDTNCNLKLCLPPHLYYYKDLYNGKT